MEGGLEKIQSLEDSQMRSRDEKTVETKGMAPVFTVPLSNLNNLKEGESAHFEGRLIPTDDPKLKVREFLSVTDTKHLPTNTLLKLFYLSFNFLNYFLYEYVYNKLSILSIFLTVFFKKIIYYYIRTCTGVQ